MKCIYCNSDQQLTSSDIITFAITGAKLTKSFVCKKHNAFTNDHYEKRFVADLDCFRNHLGLTTRDGKTVQYRADLIIDGIEIFDVKMSTNEALYSPKNVVSGVDKQGRKVLFAQSDKMQKISKGKGQKVNISDIVWHKTFYSDIFFGFYAVHSIAKIAYEWYCYNNNVEEYREEHNEIVNYILNEIDGDYVDIIIDRNYYHSIDHLSETGTNSFFQYDDIDGYRYVVFDFWKVIAYRVRICKSPENITQNVNPLILDVFRYHINGKKTNCVIGIYSFMQKPNIHTIKIQELIQESNIDLCKKFVKRVEDMMTTFLFSIYTLKTKIDTLSINLKMYDEGKKGFLQLLEFEDYRTIMYLQIISLLYANKTKYDMSKPFDKNIRVIFNLEGKTLERSLEDKNKFAKVLSTKDKKGELSEYLWDIIKYFNELFKNEMNL